MMDRVTKAKRAIVVAIQQASDRNIIVSSIRCSSFDQLNSSYMYVCTQYLDQQDLEYECTKRLSSIRLEEATAMYMRERERQEASWT